MRSDDPRNRRNARGAEKTRLKSGEDLVVGKKAVVGGGMDDGGEVVLLTDLPMGTGIGRRCKRGITKCYSAMRVFFLLDAGRKGKWIG